MEKNVQNLTAKDIGETIGTGPQREGRALNFSLSVFFFFPSPRVKFSPARIKEPNSIFVEEGGTSLYIAFAWCKP